MLVLQDLGHTNPGHWLDGLAGAEAAAVVDGLADLHRTGWNHADLAALNVRENACYGDCAFSVGSAITSVQPRAIAGELAS